MMLKWLGEQRGQQKLIEAGSEIESAVNSVLHEPSKRTRDLGGEIGTDQFGHFVAKKLTGT